MSLKILMASVLLSISFFATVSQADQPGTCYAGDDNGSYDAYCGSFGETACRMNSNVCLWYPEVPAEGLCQPRDASNAATAAYCQSFERTACRMNSNLCYWIP